MQNYAILRLLLAAFLLYFAWPYIPEAAGQVQKIFWGTWLSFLLLVVGGNLATLLQISLPRTMGESDQVEVKQRIRGL